ncbi:restriction endonuclease subunit S [Helicobacter anseris]|nr:restriction endonuclease subunit S [Helicobacter anseris]
MTPHNLPQHWQWIRLGDIAEIIGGTTPSTTNPEYWDGECPWITPAEINNDSKIIYQTKRQITQKAVKDKSLKILPIGTILLSSRAPIGKVAIVGSEMYCNQGFKNLVCDEKKIYNLYLFYFLKGKTTFLNSLGRGTTFKEISKSIVEQIEIPLPPLEIQREIVEILESKLEKITSAKAILESSLKECETYRLSLLNDAFNGNLTPHSKDWQWVRLGECLEKMTTAKLDKDTFSYIDIESIDNKTQTITTPKTLPTSKAPSRAKREVKEGDTLFSMVRPYLKNIAFVDLEFSHCVASTGFYVCRPKSNLLPKYLFFLMISPLVVNGLNQFMRGDNSPSIRSHDLENFSIPLPPLEIQREIVEILESKLEKIASAKSLLESSLKECETYRLSLLESAFKGELV